MRGLRDWIGSVSSRSSTDRPSLRPVRRRRKPNIEVLESRQVLSGITVAYSVTSDWGSGFQAAMDLQSQDPVPVPNWTLQFNLNAQISSIWDATIVSHTGTQYTIKGLSWNRDLPANGTINIGFVANPGKVAAPTNYVLNGIPLGQWATQNPIAGNDTASTYAGQATTINVLGNDSDPNGYALSVSSFTQGKNGAVKAGAVGTLIYAPKSGFVGSDSFGYTITNGHGGTASATVSVTVVAAGQSTWPTKFYAPYVDMTLYPTYSLTTAMSTAGIKDFTLAFIVADTAHGNQPSWGGYSSYDVNGGAFDTALRSQVMAVRQAGGDVMVSFGGANGTELAQAITNQTSLQSAYQTVITAYNLTQVDFDIEGAAAADHVSIDRRSQALAALQRTATAQGRALEIWLTLPVLPSGLTADGLYVVNSALKYGVKLAGVNAMAMDYGAYEAPNPSDMGTYAIQAAQSVHTQLQKAYGTSKTSAQIWQMVGLTPMIGLNDVTPEVFTLAAAQQVADFGVQVGMRRISMWSLNRDLANPRGAITYVEPTSSSLIQSPYDFSKVFVSYTKK